MAKSKSKKWSGYKRKASSDPVQSPPETLVRPTALPSPAAAETLSYPASASATLPSPASESATLLSPFTSTVAAATLPSPAATIILASRH